MSVADGAWRTDPGAQDVLAMLADGGHTAYFVGGCVRNALLDAPVADLDIATDALPPRVTELAQAAGFAVHPTGIEHGTITIVAMGTPLEVTTFRRDVQTDGRRAVVAFTDKVEEDARRRDFTMNALYARADGTILDPLGGLPDLRARHVRFIDDAHQRIREDYLRILRYFRFHAWYGDASQGLDAEALAACAELADGIEALSAERVGAEMLKLLAAPDPAPSVAGMAQAGILARVLPGAEAGHLAVLVHLEETLGAAPDAIRRLAMIGGEADGLRLSRRDAKRLTLLRHRLGGTAGVAEVAWRDGAPTARDVELLRAAGFGAPLPADLESRIARGAAAVFPVTGQEMRGRAEGAAIGDALALMEARWIASDFTATRDDLLA